MIQFFENLMINVSKNETFNVQTIISIDIDANKQFSVLLDILDAIELSTIIETLGNNVFRHRFILFDRIFSVAFASAFASTLFVLNVSIDSRYDSSKFKNLLIDSNTAT